MSSTRLLLKSYLLALLCLFLVSDLKPAFAAVNGVEEVGHSMQADMRGGTEVAVGDTALSQIRQPASCALHLKGRVDGKLTLFNPIFSSKGPIDTSHYRAISIPNFSVGYVGPLKERLYWGVTVYSKMTGKAKYRNYYPGFVGEQRSSSSLTNYACAATFSYKLRENLMVGVAPRIELLAASGNALRDGFNVDFNKSYSTGAGYTVGVLYLPRPNIYLGASYRSSTWMIPLATSRSSLVPASGGPQILGELKARAFTLPQRVSFGASWKPRENLRFATEAGWIADRNSILASTNLGGILNAGVPIGFRDVWLINAGFDYDFKNGLGVSGGYSFNTQPIAANRVVPVFASTNQNNITYGVRYTKDRWWAGAAHIIGLPSSARNRGVSPYPGTPQYNNAKVSEFIQSVTFGVGFNL